MRRLILLGALVALMPTVSTVAQAGPPPMDPRNMSGIPRPDPQVPAGTVTVRCLLGSFSEPAVGLDVTLEITTADGQSETRTATTQEQGRATFDGLGDFIGKQAVARVSFEGEEVRSAPITLQADMGSRVMLVKGATAPPAAAPSAAGSPHGGAGEVPPPGKPFPLDGQPAGTLVVGTLDLEQRGRAEGIEVELTITPPGGEPTVRTGKSDATGRVVFKGLVPPDVPAGSELQVEAVIREGGEAQRSETFTLGETAMAVYLAEGLDSIERSGSAPAPRTQRAPVPGPRVADDLPAGSVRIRIIDGNDRPVPNQPVEVWKKDVTGNDVSFRGATGGDGVAVVADVTVQEDAFYFVGAAHSGAPYQSGFFELTDRAGVAVDMRVFPVTHDPSRVRSAVQFEVRPRENDQAQVLQAYQVFVEGDEAFWPAEGKLRISGPDGTKGLVVLRQAQRWLVAKDGAPYAELDGPLAPGEVADLSVAYLLPHDGELAVEWVPPFPVVESSVVLERALSLLSPTVSPSDPRHEGAQDVQLYPLGERPMGASIAFTVGDLPVRPSVFRWIALGLGAVVALGMVLAVWRRPRRSERETLEVRRRELEALLAGSSGAERERIIGALDDVFRRLDALDGPATKPQPAAD